MNMKYYASNKNAAPIHRQEDISKKAGMGKLQPAKMVTGVFKMERFLLVWVALVNFQTQFTHLESGCLTADVART